MAIQMLTTQEVSAVSGGASSGAGLVGGLASGLVEVLNELTSAPLISAVASSPLVSGLTGLVGKVLQGVLGVVAPILGELPL